MVSPLKIGVFIEVVEYFLGEGVLFQINNDAQSLSVGLVSNVANALNLFFFDELRDFYDQFRFVDLIGDGRNDDLILSLFFFGYFGLSAINHSSPAGGVGLMDFVFIKNKAAGRKVRTLNEFNQVLGRGFGVAYQVRGRVNYFVKVMRRGVGGHADRYFQRAG